MDGFLVFGRVRTTVPVPAPPSVELSCLFIKTPSLRQSLIILDFCARGKGLSELNIHAPLYFGFCPHTKRPSGSRHWASLYVDKIRENQAMGVGCLISTSALIGKFAFAKISRIVTQNT